MKTREHRLDDAPPHADLARLHGEDPRLEAARDEHAVDQARHLRHMLADLRHGRAPLVGRQVVGLEHLGDEAERRQRVPQVVDEHGDVVAPLRLEHALQPEGLERGAHAREELARVDGLRQVGVGALLETGLDGVRLAPRGGEHDHGRASAAPRAKATQHLDAVHAGHRHVEQHELRLVLLDLCSARRRSAPCARGGRPR